ncbi:RING-H2 finger protein ATL74-like [Canna indica]|uniref:RING-H2 finger protein ATL74-like n=1 Tax=Canna indica TaxID=4628 RepID=A0AAQ3KA20_9LILI|nr:RING-H2 finger protein ATL74-like [Canna indica]
MKSSGKRGFTATIDLKLQLQTPVEAKEEAAENGRGLLKQKKNDVPCGSDPEKPPVSKAFRRNFRSITRPQADRRRGLSLDELEKTPCYEFKVGEKMSDTTDCAVCLESFQVGERCRLLTACRHSFHAQCVDSWLLKSSICQICRRSANGLKAGKAGSDEVEMREVREGQVVVVGVSLSGDHPIPHASSSR